MPVCEMVSGPFHLRENVCSGQDFSCQDIDHTVLSGCRFEVVDFSDALLEHCAFEACVFNACAEWRIAEELCFLLTVRFHTAAFLLRNFISAR